MPRLGRYEILDELGHGAMGTVYRARDPKLDRVVALKTITVVSLSPADEEEYRQRFFREAQAAGKLSHSGIVTIYDVGEEESTQTPFIVMEFIEGQTLEELARGERLPTEVALGLVKQVAEALDSAHSQEIVHRDIKPANILVTPDGRAKITDFGVAKLPMTQFTQPGQVLGTPAYMSPEQLTGGGVDGRSDLFSLGVILYWLLTGDKPFTGDTTTAVCFKIVYKDPIPPSQLNPSLGPDYDYVVERALAKDPGRRYQRGREFADDLEDFQSGRPPRSRGAQVAAPEVERTVVAHPRGAPPTPTAPAKTATWPPAPIAERAAAASLPPPAKKRGWLRPAGVTALLLLLLGAGAWWWRRESAPAVGARSQPRQAEARPRPVAMATLRLRGEHNFDRATLYVYADEKLLSELKLSGETLERSGVAVGFGTISARLPLSAGKHTITLRIQAPRDDFDQIQYIQGSFEPGQTRTLEISLGKVGKWIGIGGLTRKLTLRWVD